MPEDTDSRANIKCDPATLNKLDALKRNGETWDGLLNRAADALHKETPLAAFPNAVIYTHHDEKYEGVTEVYENWVRVGGGIIAWLPREEIEQLHET